LASECAYEFTLSGRQEDEYKEFKRFEKNYFKKNPNIIKYIITAELTLKGMVHYHAYFSFKNKVSVIKQMIQPMYFKGNVLPLYGTQPKKGIHYLFKTSTDLKEYFGDKEAIRPNGLTADTPLSP